MAVRTDNTRGACEWSYITERETRATIISQLIRPILLHMYENVDALFLCRVNACRANWANSQVLFDFWLSNVIQDTLNSVG